MSDTTGADVEVEIETTPQDCCLIVTAASGTDEDQCVLNLAAQAINKLWADGGMIYDDEEDDRLTIGELLKRNGLGVDDIERERRLDELHLTDLEVGDMVEVSSIQEGEPSTPVRGVIAEIDEPTDTTDTRAELIYGGAPGGMYENLKESRDGNFRIGRRAPAYGYLPLYDIEVLNLEDVDDGALLKSRRICRALTAVDGDISQFTVETEEIWETNDGEEMDPTTDRHARVTVSGGPLAEPVPVKLTNLDNVTVEADLDEDTEALVRYVAKKNSPISLNVRL